MEISYIKEMYKKEELIRKWDKVLTFSFEDIPHGEINNKHVGINFYCYFSGSNKSFLNFIKFNRFVLYLSVFLTRCFSDGVFIYNRIEWNECL